jgi:hypothetical protein
MFLIYNEIYQLFNLMYWGGIHHTQYFNPLGQQTVWHFMIGVYGALVFCWGDTWGFRFFKEVTHGSPPTRMYYSHSMVAGGLELISYATLFTPFTSLMMRFDMRLNTL